METCGPSTERQGQDGEELKAILSYTVSFRLAWAIGTPYAHHSRKEKRGNLHFQAIPLAFSFPSFTSP